MTMDNAGVKNLGALQVTSAVTDLVLTEGVSAQNMCQDFIDSLGGMSSVSLSFNFTYGSGGTSVAVVVQTSFDGVNWIDIARADFATASKPKLCNVSAGMSRLVTEPAVLSAEGVNDGFLGDRLRAIVTSVGTYGGNTSVSVRAAVR